MHYIMLLGILPGCSMNENYGKYLIGLGVQDSKNRK